MRDPIADVIDWARRAAAPGSVLAEQAEQARDAHSRLYPRLVPTDRRCRNGAGSGSIHGCVNPPEHLGGCNWID